MKRVLVLVACLVPTLASAKPSKRPDVRRVRVALEEGDRTAFTRCAAAGFFSAGVAEGAQCGTAEDSVVCAFPNEGPMLATQWDGDYAAVYLLRSGPDGIDRVTPVGTMRRRSPVSAEMIKGMDPAVAASTCEMLLGEDSVLRVVWEAPAK